ncbi:uncharacterized protein PV07_06292 [Cladophialophora immunda]|uniref:Enoyl reductase (ER) domain-containing protein n=1 Tax=Cladophialophora immunda TaxID=569365 RepID=A0A0D2D4G2_9EURO|nr:uncharacterized protein PV07_06292 [Cladophialophora immunda]KIW30554.1 hypothetical protein PV07_06292 [Cladophialophora immunda]
MGLPSTVSRGQYLLHPKQLQLREVEIGKLGPEEVEIAPRSTTICGSDLHYYAHGRNGSITVKEPLCLGHESAGDVVAVGTAVNGLRPGDRVAVECGVPCSECELCVEGRYNLCPKLRFRSSGSAFPHFQGTLQERIIHPAKWVHRLPDCLTFDDGALLEPLSVACHAVRRAGVTPASTCLVFGAGAVGLLCAAVARSKGCARIVMCDIDKRRVNFALQKGFAQVGWVVDRRRASNVEEEMANAQALARDIASQNWPEGGPVGKPSITFECTGVPSCVQSSIYATKSGGRVMLVGMGTPNHTLPLSEAGAREVDLMSTWRYANCYEEAIDLMTKVAEGSVKPDIREIITHHHKGLENVQDAFGLAGSSQDSDGNLVIKVVIDT